MSKTSVAVAKVSNRLQCDSKGVVAEMRKRRSDGEERA